MFGILEGTGYEVLDAEFEECIIGHARVERLWTGMRWSEGTAWFPAGRYLIWSDIPNNRLMRWDETDGSVSVFREPSNNANGNTRDAQGRLVSCEHLTRRVTRTEHDGMITVLADSYNGSALNSPNDVVVKSDGSIWFTDPSYGIMMDYEGERAKPEIDGCHVYRIDAKTKNVTAVAVDFNKPNGLAFSNNEDYLFVSDTGITHDPDGPKHIRKIVVNPDGQTLGKSQIFSECSVGVFDGFRLDTSGRVWCSAADGVHCLNSSGKLIGKILIPEMTGNLCFGGPKLNRLFVAGTSSLYSVYLNVNGV
ncbi:SMP-30/gluconolactonase/LRE family protein [Amylibacter sp. SFDW26]|uniref:SMP-30/gluconolactonase/LRE family protein n=1 Tax=Amylibacter sp. SFDW26 TaxID=2652722 RepID=UPI001261F799|nr:SMP-30/gluconolactonase/LRE family protein [Amylibacter sp. SFDW26]KAB7610169.1 SMP-30/gluconolactonase/LRE family protein [Amylibacter sp. SFDW26]